MNSPIDALPPSQKAVRLIKGHEVAEFDCGKPPLNDFLIKYALQNQSGGSARTYVALRNRRVVGYYSLAPGHALLLDTPPRIAKGQPNHPVPVVLMARFAVDLSEQGKGLGKALFYDALLRANDGAEAIGGRAFMVNAKDEDALAFYTKHGMEPSPKDPFTLFLLFKDIRQSFGLANL